MASPFAFLPHRAVLSLSGPDTLVLLERLVTHETSDWVPGEARYGALLTPQGKVLADYLAVRTADGVLLDVDRDQVADLAKRLKLFRLRAQVEITLREDLFVIAGIEDAKEGVRHVSGAAYVFLDQRYPGNRLRAFATEADWAAWYGYHPAEWSKPLDEYHKDRIANGVPEQGSDFGSAEVFPADINMDVYNGVALTKGCFVGQEVVSRMHRRGKIRKRSLRVISTGAEVLNSGVDIIAEAPIGQLTSVEGCEGLGLIRIDRLLTALDKGVPLTVGGIAVSVDIPAWHQREVTPQAAND